MQTEKNMQNVINSLTQTNTLTQSQTSNPNISYAALDLNKYNSTRFEYYPKLGILNLMFDLRNDKLLHLNLNLIEGEESFDWRSRSRTDVRNVIDYYSGNLSSKENKKMEATMDRNTFEGKLYKRYW